MDKNKNRGNTSEVKNCGVCNKGFNKKEYKLLCNDNCGRWICQKCSNLNKTKIESMVKKNEVFICRDCCRESFRKSIISPNSLDESSDEEQEKYTISDIMRQMKKNDDMRRNVVRDLQRSMQFLSDSYEDENDNTLNVVSSILEHIDCRLQPEDIKVKRLSKKELAPILVELRDIDARNLILEERRSRGEIRLSNCSYGVTNIVDFKEDSSRTTQDLFAKTRRIKNEKMYKYACVKNGRIYMKKTEGSRAILIQDETDLNVK
ncbi:hypothetical protein WA026_020317 [Henosepilachna vigintioctopunctata]|uniref:FP protein C-terminal domain-containing protein n=1 Tax=Henosepilachna vigintioctopunctata TaxID=420089 RepID=A0AAW1U0S8_9CUCU